MTILGLFAIWVFLNQPMGDPQIAALGPPDCTFTIEDNGPGPINPYLVLTPGWNITLEGPEKERVKRLAIEVLDETRVINGIETRVVREREWLGEVLVEESYHFYAICQKDGSVWYFGEQKRTLHDKYRLDESWLAGDHGALCVMAMPGSLTLGQAFISEYVPGVEVEQLKIKAFMPVTINGMAFGEAVVFERTDTLKDTPPDEVIYAPGIGLIKDDDGLLIFSWGNTLDE